MGCSLHGERVLSGGQAPPRGLRAKPMEAVAHLAVDIGQAGLDGLQRAARGVAEAAGSASGVERTCECSSRAG